MRRRRLGGTDLDLTVIGLGTFAMGGKDWRFSWGPQDDAESAEAIHKALDFGINWIDTAAVYGFGHSEEVVGRALAGLKAKPYLATKFGRIGRPGSQLWGCLKKESVVAECEASLRRLKTETIDLYQIHWPDPEEDLEEGWEAVATLVKAGKVRYAGVSNFSVAQLKRVQPIFPVSSLQPPYSLLRRDIEPDILPYCQAQNIGVIAYSPMQKGLLTGTFSPARALALPAEDHRRRDPDFLSPRIEVHLGLVDGLTALAGRSGHSIGQLAVAWVLRRPEVTAAIVGARRGGQIEEIVPAGDWALTAGEVKSIEDLLQKHQAALKSLP